MAFFSRHGGQFTEKESSFEADGENAIDYAWTKKDPSDLKENCDKCSKKKIH
jgi:hypothetical protein